MNNQRVYLEALAIETSVRCARSFARGDWKRYVQSLDRWLALSLSREVRP